MTRTAGNKSANNFQASFKPPPVTCVQPKVLPSGISQCPFNKYCCPGVRGPLLSEWGFTSLPPSWILHIITFYTPAHARQVYPTLPTCSRLSANHSTGTYCYPDAFIRTKLKSALYFAAITCAFQPQLRHQHRSAHLYRQYLRLV